MKFSICILMQLLSLVCLSQNIQTSIGINGIKEIFNEVKFDPSDESTIHVGYINNPASSNGNDCFIVKLGPQHEIIWQKVINNAGHDQFSQIKIAANGDYIVVGEFTQAGVIRGLISRINPANGNLIWSYTTSGTGSANGDKIYDLYETANNNIVAVGVTNFSSGLTNSLAVLLNSGGAQLWALSSNFGSADEFYCVNQLPNGNILIGGFCNNTGFSYAAVIIELNETTGAILNQNRYQLSVSIPGYSTFNSLWLTKCYRVNNTIYFLGGAFQGFGSDAVQIIYKYDLASKNLTGNAYFRTGLSNATAYTLKPIGENEILISQSYNLPSPSNFVSRLLNNSIVFDRRLDNDVEKLTSSDIINDDVVYSGSTISSNALSLFTTTSVPLSSGSGGCEIINASNLLIQSVNHSAIPGNIISLNSLSAIVSNTYTFNNTNYELSVLCGCIFLSENQRYSTVNGVINTPIQLQARNFSGASYLWNPNIGLSNSMIQNPVFNNGFSQEYLIRISVPNHCQIVDTVFVNLTTQPLPTGIFVPQGFTPNGDGNNDRLHPFLVNINQLKYFKIYNRWGNLIYETNSDNPALGWDGTYRGKKQPVETYTWIAEGVDIYGQTIKKAGNTLLIN